MNLAYPTAPTAQQVQGFGNSNPAMYPGTGRHMGIDIAASVGTPIFAVCPGIVDTANLVGAHGYGRHVILEHGEFKTLYAHLHRVFVYAGQTVETGALIGEMGGDPTDSDKIDGASTGPHLHFELILDKEPKVDFVKTVLGWTVDPFKYLLERFASPPIWIGTVIDKAGLRVRTAPDNATGKNVLYALQKNMTFEVAELIFPKGDTWARIRSLRTEWVCVKYQKATYVELAPPTGLDTPRESGGATRPPEAEQAARLDEVKKLIAYLEARAKELV
jgi:hypothetical protein